MNRDKAFLQHILKEIDFTSGEIRNINYDGFRNNEMLTRACTRSLEIIGEAAKTSRLN